MPESQPASPARALNPLQSALLEASSNEPLRDVSFAGRLGIMAILSFSLVSIGFILMEGWSNWKDLDGDLIRRGLHTLSIIRIGLYLIAAIWFLRWTFLCAANAKRIAPQNPDINPATAVGSFFIPILNFITPYQQILGIVEVTEKRLAQFDIKPLVRPWWLAWWGMNAVWVLGSEIRTPAVMAAELLLTLSASSWSIRLISKLSQAQSEIRPPFEVIHVAPRPKPKREQVRKPSKPGYAAAKPASPLPQRTPPSAQKPPTSSDPP
jgi:hypothetical protein